MFDRGMLHLKPLSERVNDLDLSVIRRLGPAAETKIDQKWERIAKLIIEAKNKKLLAGILV